MIVVETWFEELLHFLWDNRKKIQKEIETEQNVCDLILDMIPEYLRKNINEKQGIWLVNRIRDKYLFFDVDYFSEFVQSILDDGFPITAKYELPEW